jgi:hypothetical protein
MILWDLDGCPDLEGVGIALRSVQKKYRLSNIYIVSDKPGHYRAFCFTRVDFIKYLEILTSTPYVDFNFIWWTVYYACGTLRYSPKEGRPISQDTVLVLKTHYVDPPEESEIVINVYDTATDGKSHSMVLKAREDARIKRVPMVINAR